MTERLLSEIIQSSELLKPSQEVITGPMFSGKSKELITRLLRSAIAIESMQKSGILTVSPLEERIMVFKPTIDIRRGDHSVNSQDGETFPAIPIDNAAESERHISLNTLIIGFDEAQFWPEEDLVKTVRTLSLKRRVLVAGLSLDFRGEKWGGVGRLLLESEKPYILPAVCTVCGGVAIFTQRIIEENRDGQKVRRPAFYEDPVEVVGSTDLYEARCRVDHQVPHRPSTYAF